MTALERATAVRAGIADVKRAVKAHELSIEAALMDPKAHGMSLCDLLIAQYGWGAERVWRAFRRAGKEPSLRRVGDLTDRERAAIVRACKETGR
jgi:hypothetical protein